MRKSRLKYSQLSPNSRRLATKFKYFGQKLEFFLSNLRLEIKMLLVYRSSRTLVRKAKNVCSGISCGFS